MVLPVRAQPESDDSQVDSDDDGSKGTGFPKGSARAGGLADGDAGAQYVVDFGGAAARGSAFDTCPDTARVDAQTSFARNFNEIVYPNLGEEFAAPTFIRKEDGNQKWTYATYEEVTAGAESDQGTGAEYCAAAYATANQVGVLALGLLETILKRRYPSKTGAEAARTEVFPHQWQDGTSSGVPANGLFNNPLFDEMLSYCSCYYLAQWLFEKYGANANAPELSLATYSGAGFA